MRVIRIFTFKLTKVPDYYYYYYRFMAPWTVSGTTGVSWYQTGKTRKVKPI